MATRASPSVIEPFPFFELPRELRDQVYKYAGEVRMFDTSTSFPRKVPTRPTSIKSLITAYLPLKSTPLVSRRFAHEYKEISRGNYELHIEAPIREVEAAVWKVTLLNLDDPKKPLFELGRFDVTTSLTRDMPAAWWYTAKQYGRNIGSQLAKLGIPASCEVRIDLLGAEDERECMLLCSGLSMTARDLEIGVHCLLKQKKEKAVEASMDGASDVEESSGSIEFMCEERAGQAQGREAQRGVTMSWTRDCADA